MICQRKIIPKTIGIKLDVEVGYSILRTFRMRFSLRTRGVTHDFTRHGGFIGGTAGLAVGLALSTLVPSLRTIDCF